ncbi:hypothetical protein ES703_59591 [subsurface metagenome]
MGGFSTPAAAVSNFLGLTDTPPAYAGEALKGARVNVAENALEFSRMAEERVFPRVFAVGYQLFAPALCPIAFTDLGCTVDTGAADTGVVGPAWVLLRITGNANYLFRENGETKDMTVAKVAGCSCGGAVPDNYVIVPTDENGLIEWRGDAVVNTTIQLLANWNRVPKPEATIYTGAMPADWITISTGVPNALCMLRVEPIQNMSTWFKLRPTGDIEPHPNGGVTTAPCVAGKCWYTLIITDSNGQCDLRHGDVNTCTIILHSYILGCSFPNLSLAQVSGIMEVATPYSNAVIFCRSERTAGGGSPSLKFWRHGEVNAFSESGGLQPRYTNDCYAVLFTDVNGVFDSEGAGDQINHLTALCVSQ